MYLNSLSMVIRNYFIDENLKKQFPNDHFLGTYDNHDDGIRFMVVKKSNVDKIKTFINELYHMSGVNVNYLKSVMGEHGELISIYTLEDGIY